MLRGHLRDFAIARIIVPALCLGLSLTGCSGGGSSHNDAPTSTPASVSTTVSATQGGTVTGPDGVQVIVPANALAADTQITIKKSAASAAPLTLSDGTVLPIKSDGVYELLPHGIAFTTPVTVRIPVSGDTSQLAAYMSEPDSGWYPVASTAGSGYLEFTRTHFSSVAVASEDMMRWTLSRFQHVNISGKDGIILRAAYDASATTLNIPAGIAFSYAVDFSLNLASNTFNSTSCTSPQLVASLDDIPFNEPVSATVTQKNSLLNIHASPSGTFNSSLAGTHTLSFEVRCAAFTSKPPQLRLNVNVVPQAEWADDRYALYLTSPSNFARDWSAYGYTFGGDGTLTAFTPAKVADLAGPGAAMVSPDGTSLSIAHSGGISQFSIGKNGLLSALSSTTTASSNPFEAVAAPLGNYAYIFDALGGSFSQYAVGNNAALSALSPAQVNAGQTDSVSLGNHLAIAANGAYLYAAFPQAGKVGQYAIGSDGTLSALGTPFIATQDPNVKAFAIAAHPAGQYVYVLQTSQIVQYAIGGDGQLSAISSVQPNTRTGPVDMAVDPTGKFLYVAMEDSIVQYAIGSNGELAPLAPATVASYTPDKIIAEPSGQYLSVYSSSLRNLSRFAIGSDGTLSRVSVTDISNEISTDPVSIARDIAASNLMSFAIAKYRPVFTVAGSAALNGDSVTLQLNGSNNLTLSNDGAFTFSAPLSAGSYNVTVLTQPGNGDTCTVANGSGTIADAAIANVAVICTASTYPINVTVSGLTSGDSVTLLNNGGNALAVNMNGTSNFSTGIAAGSTYNVTVQSQTGGQACVVSNGGGTIERAAASVTVNCSAQSYTVGGSVSGLIGSSDTVTLQLTSGGNSTSKVVTGNSSFTLDPALLHGASYTISVLTQSSTNSCSVSTGGSGTIAGANISNVAISCSASLYSIGGTISNLSSAGLVLANGSDTRTVSQGATSFTMPTSQITGASYYITVRQQPSGDTCAVTNQGSGSVGTANVTDITVVCAANQYTVGGSVSGLANSNDTVTLQLSDGTTPTNTIVTGNSSFTLSPNLPDGTNYTVAVVGQPSGQVCSVTSGGSGTINSASVSNVTVSCQSSGGGSYIIGGTVSGLMPGSFVVLQNNSGDNLTVNGTGAPVSFQFATPVAGSYSVTVLSKSMGVMMCSVSGGSGSASANVTNIGVSCF